MDKLGTCAYCEKQFIDTDIVRMKPYPYHSPQADLYYYVCNCGSISPVALSIEDAIKLTNIRSRHEYRKIMK